MDSTCRHNKRMEKGSFKLWRVPLASAFVLPSRYHGQNIFSFHSIKDIELFGCCVCVCRPLVVREQIEL